MRERIQIATRQNEDEKAFRFVILVPSSKDRKDVDAEKEEGEVRPTSFRADNIQDIETEKEGEVCPTSFRAFGQGNGKNRCQMPDWKL
jgi:hypothetical protein